jgi:peptidyl-prolyl cis-trans isomerase C
MHPVSFTTTLLFAALAMPAFAQVITTPATEYVAPRPSAAPKPAGAIIAAPKPAAAPTAAAPTATAKPAVAVAAPRPAATAVVAPRPAAAPATTTASDPAAPYLIVNNIPIPQHLVDTFIAEQKANGANTNAPGFKNAVRDEMIRRGALLAEAKKQELDKRTAYKRQLEISGQVILMREVVAEYIKKNPVTDAELNTAYKATLSKLGTTEYKLRHIQCKTEDDAKAIIAKLDDGKKFEKLVKDSTDETTRDQGGDLGWKIPVALPPTVSERVAVLKKGDYTKVPVKVDANWHVFQAVELRALTPPKLEEIKTRLIQGVLQVKAAQYIENLKKAAQVN